MQCRHQLRPVDVYCCMLAQVRQLSDEVSRDPNSCKLLCSSQQGECGLALWTPPPGSACLSQRMTPRRSPLLQTWGSRRPGTRARAACTSVDINGRAIHVWEAATGEHFTIEGPEMVGTVALTTDEDVILAALHR